MYESIPDINPEVKIKKIDGGGDVFFSFYFDDFSS